MKEILFYLPLLAISIVSNVLVGIYYNVNIKDFKFDWHILVNGILKSLIVASVFVGLTYVFDQIPSLVETIGVEPKFVMISAIALYSGKALVGLGKILGIEVKTKQ